MVCLFHLNFSFLQTKRFSRQTITEHYRTTQRAKRRHTSSFRFVVSLCVSQLPWDILSCLTNFICSYTFTFIWNVWSRLLCVVVDRRHLHINNDNFHVFCVIILSLCSRPHQRYSFTSTQCRCFFVYLMPVCRDFDWKNVHSFSWLNVSPGRFGR